MEAYQFRKTKTVVFRKKKKRNSFFSTKQCPKKIHLTSAWKEWRDTLGLNKPLLEFHSENSTAIKGYIKSTLPAIRQDF